MHLFNKKTSCIKTKNGFTLIELMVVLAIISILSATAIPSYINYLDKAKFAEMIVAFGPIKTDLTLCVATSDCVNAAQWSAISSDGTYFFNDNGTPNEESDDIITRISFPSIPGKVVNTAEEGGWKIRSIAPDIITITGIPIERGSIKASETIIWNAKVHTYGNISYSVNINSGCKRRATGSIC